MGTLYTNNFRGRAGRTERAHHIVQEFDAIEEAFTRLQALNIATYLTIYTNTTVLSGTITISPDNGFLQELTLTADAAIQLASPLNESQYRVALLIHGSKFKVTNLWGAQTWKEYGLGSWWELYCGDGPYASMLLDFFWDICSNTWICVASSKNQLHLIEAGVEERLYPLLYNLENIEGDDTLGFSRASGGMIWDSQQAYHYLIAEEARFAGARYIDNWAATPSDLTSVGWVATDVTITTDEGAGPFGSDTNRLNFDVTGGKVATFILPSFGRAGRNSDPIKVVVSFKGKSVSGTESLRLYASFMGKTALDPPVHDVVQIEVDNEWRAYGAVLDVLKEGNSTVPLALNQEYPKTLLEIALSSPSGSAGGDIQVTDVQIEVLRGTDAEVPSEIQDSTIGASMVLTSSGTGTWVDGTKVMTLSSVGEYVDFSANLVIGKTYLVHPRLTDGSAADIRMQNEVTVWAAGLVSDDHYLQDAPFTFRYDGGILKFVLMAGINSIYSIDIYEVSGEHSISGFVNESTIGEDHRITYETGIPVTSEILDGVAREIASENLIPFNFFRSFSAWDSVGLSGVEVNDCKSPVFQSEYGLDQWPARATILQGASKVADGFIQRSFTIPAASETKDFTMWIRRTLDVEGNQIYFAQHDDVTVPLSRYVDFEAELTGGVSTIGGGRIRLDLQEATFDAVSTADYGLGIFLWSDWYHIVISLANDGTHDGFRVRVYPASNVVGDPSEVDVTTQGWCVIDWAQLEDEGGTFAGSSPIVGGETRVIEEFTSALADGHFYRAEGMEHVATLTSNSMLWDNFDGVYRNLLYSTTLMSADIVARNMHEFGLVEEESAPTVLLTIMTTTLYPVEVTEEMQLGIAFKSGYMRPIVEDTMDVSFDILGGELRQILKTVPTVEDELDIYFTISGGFLKVVLKTLPTVEDELDVNFTITGGELISKLVVADTPDEELQLDCTLKASACYMTPV